ncbi:MAG: response regulator, partial [Spirochaetes bacterium]|nr:response regulator [Spirochaetota bacterium]
SVIHPDDKNWVIGEIKKAYKERTAFEITYRIRTQDGRERWMWQVGSSIISNNAYEQSNKIKGGIGFITDITESKIKDQQLLQAQKMESIGTLAGGIAHDFNNVLGGITGTLSILEVKLKLLPEEYQADLNHFINILKISSERAVDMVQQLLALSRKQELSLSSVDINLALKNVIKIGKSTFDKSIEIIFFPYEKKAIIEADATQIEQCFLNIAINASHAMTIMRKPAEKQGGQLTIKIERILNDIHFRKKHPEASYEEYWLIEVIDTGVGMDSDTIAKIFDPFYTTKSKGQGTGLGMLMVYNIIKQHHGFITIYSEVGLGTKICVYFPLQEVIKTTDLISSTDEIPRGEGIILVIDDEEILRGIAKSILEECGYDVLVAKDGEEGIDIFRQNKKQIRAVLLDMVMPKKTGKEAFIKMKKIDPNVKVVLSSGFRQDERVKEVMNLGILEFVQKPYTLTRLAQVFDKILNQ